MFSIQYRERVRDFVLQKAEADARVVAGAVVGSLALSDGDQRSDLDLTFGVENGAPLLEVLEDWTHTLVEEFSAAHLFDVTYGPSIYRVFLLPGCLQVDLSFTPAAQFGAIGPKFRLLFGSAVERPLPPPPTAHEIFGQAVHHALRARFCLERGRYWQAEYWLSSLRDSALTLACRRLGLPASYARGFDDLHPEVLESLRGAFAHSLERVELLRALSVAIEGLLRETTEVPALADQVAPELRKLMGGGRLP